MKQGEKHSGSWQTPSGKGTPGGKKSKGRSKRVGPRSSSPGHLESLDDLDDITASVKRKLSGHLTHNLDNPFKRILVEVPYYWETEDTLLSLIRQFVGGYVWACKHDETFIAVHNEAPRLQRLYDGITAYLECKADPEKDEEEFYGQRFAAWCLVELATLLPSMWD